MPAADIFTTHRRYLFAKSLSARLAGNWVDNAWDGKRRDMPGTDIPSTVPYLDALDTAGYWALEDLQGATASELVSAGLTRGQAAAVIAALE